MAKCRRQSLKPSNFSLFRWLEFVADLSDCMDEGRVVGVGFDFVSQGGDEPVDASMGNECTIAPDGV